MFLHLNLGKDHVFNSLDTYYEMLLGGLQSSKRMNRDDTQITSLVRILLEFSGGRVDLRQHKLDQEYTTTKNADLYASIFGIVRTEHFAKFDSDKMYNTLSKSSIDIRELKEWTTKMMEPLRLGFGEGYQVRYPDV